MIDLTAQTVLVVDDQEFVRTIVRSMLLQMGVTCVLEAADGTQAFSMVNVQTPDIIICDVQMRPTSGFGFVKMLRETPGTNNIPVIMLTAHADEATLSKAKELDVDDFISKPVLPSTLASTITQVLARRGLN